MVFKKELKTTRKDYYDDVLDELAQIVLTMSGEVMLLKGEDMPGDTGVAAIFRY